MFVGGPNSDFSGSLGASLGASTSSAQRPTARVSPDAGSAAAGAAGSTTTTWVAMPGGYGLLRHARGAERRRAAAHRFRIVEHVAVQLLSFKQKTLTRRQVNSECIEARVQPHRSSVPDDLVNGVRHSILLCTHSELHRHVAPLVLPQLQPRQHRHIAHENARKQRGV